MVDPTNLGKLKCKLCGKNCSGGIYRLKQHVGHIKGNVASCPRSTKEDQDKCKTAIEASKVKKKEKKKQEEIIREEVQIDEKDKDEEIEIVGSKKRPHYLGAMDRWATSINFDSGTNPTKRLRQQKMNETLFKEKMEAVHQYLAKWVYETCIHFHAITLDSFDRFIEAVGQFGLGY